MLVLTGQYDHLKDHNKLHEPFIPIFLIVFVVELTITKIYMKINKQTKIKKVPVVEANKLLVNCPENMLRCIAAHIISYSWSTLVLTILTVSYRYNPPVFHPRQEESFLKKKKKKPTCPGSALLNKNGCHVSPKWGPLY